MMGSPSEMMEGIQGGGGGSSHTKATFSGMTALIGVLALIVSIISVAVPHWGSYSPIGQQYVSAGFASQDNTGHFGPFQVCKYQAYYSFCGSNQSYFTPSTWLIVAGICAIVTVLGLAFFSLFAVLHVAMQLQRREIMVSFQKDVFFKLVASSICVLSTFATVILGALEFNIGGRNNFLQYRMGICYYLQIFLIFVNILLVILSYMTYRKARRHPLNIVPKGRAGTYAPGPYDNRYMDGGTLNGVSMTATSGQPYNHGQPRQPIHPATSNNFAPSYNNAISYGNGHPLPTIHYNGATQATQPGPQTAVAFTGGQINGGFTAVNLHAAAANNHHQNGSTSLQSHNVPQPLPIQAIRPIQPVQGIPQAVHQPHMSIAPHPVNLSHLPQVLPSSGVSFTPAGRGYNKMPSGHTGSTESLDSTQSLTLSNFSYGSSTSTGPRRSSLKKPRNKDNASITSESSSKRVRYGLGAEQTTV